MSSAFRLVPGWSADTVLDAISQALRAGICVTDRQGRFAAVSQGYCDIYGYRADELIGRHFGLLVPEPMRAEAARMHDRFLEVGEEVAAEWEVVAADGRPLQVRVGAARFFDADGNPYKMTAVEDITAFRQTEGALTAANRELERLNRAKDRLFSIIGHDLREPFNPILAYAEMMSSTDADLDRDRVMAYARQIREAASSVLTLLDSLLAWARLQMESAAVRTADCPLDRLIGEVLGDLEAVIRLKELVVTTAIDSPVVRADPFMARTAIRNIVANATKFTPRGGAITIELARPEEATGPLTSAMIAGQVVIAIRDTGVGMDEALLAQLFSSGGGIMRPGTEAEAGSGFGLQVAREMIERNGGVIAAVSTPGEGSTFYLSFPRSAG